MQVIRFEHYKTNSSKIRARVVPSIAPRGKISDRNQKILVASQPAFSAYILPMKVKDFKFTAKKIAQIVNGNEQEIYKKMVVQDKNRSFEPLLIKDYISFKDISLIEEESYNIPSFIVGVRSVRYYPYGLQASHVLGYIGQINQETLSQKQIEGYRIGDIIGLSGVEKEYEHFLRGIDGGQQIEVDPSGRPVKILGNINPIQGSNLTLTLDIELQKIAMNEMKNKKGAVVVLNPKNGDILALYSSPNFDPNLFTKPISQKNWDKMHYASKPLHNRAIATYPPGSIFKLITSVAALEKNITNPERVFYCPGYMMIGKRKAECWKAHGRINFFDGVINSCDVVFYTLGLELGAEQISRYGSEFGFGTKTMVDLPGESRGTMPNNNWKKRVFHESWYPGDSFNLAIGQGFMQASPLQVAYMISIIANKGIGFKPHLLDLVDDYQGKIIYQYKPEIINTVHLRADTWNFLHDSMEQTVLRGTGVATKIEGLRIAGKTGTAEDPPRKQPHAWFASFAPVDNPQLVVVVFVESGGHGGSISAPIAKKIYQAYFK